MFHSFLDCREIVFLFTELTEQPTWWGLKNYKFRQKKKNIFLHKKTKLVTFKNALFLLLQLSLSTTVFTFQFIAQPLLSSNILLGLSLGCMYSSCLCIFNSIWSWSWGFAFTFQFQGPALCLCSWPQNSFASLECTRVPSVECLLHSRGSWVTLLYIAYYGITMRLLFWLYSAFSFFVALLSFSSFLLSAIFHYQLICIHSKMLQLILLTFLVGVFRREVLSSYWILFEADIRICQSFVFLHFLHSGEACGFVK